jgi:hypothetical protein
MNDKAALQAERAEAIEALHNSPWAKGTPGYRELEDKVIWLNGKLYRLEDER